MTCPDSDEIYVTLTNEIGKRIQALAICIAHSLLRLFGAKIEREEGIVDTKVIKAWHERLEARAKAAAKAGGELPLALYKAPYRPTEVSLHTVRAPPGDLLQGGSGTPAATHGKIFMMG